ncbi:protein FAM180A [Silurus asotus]|uniref:Protein FAM180A n=1 Tax=Silurus asotus TaxID=30991 RepID=A0AAD5FNX5_SILAS|nr:protein FAM180A [Silurus asotus]
MEVCGILVIGSLVDLSWQRVDRPCMRWNWELIKRKGNGEQFLLRGLVIDEDNNVGIRDQEMASMKQGRVFLSLINDDIPKTVLAMEELLIMLEEEEQSFNQGNFETLLLGIIYSAYQVHDKRQESQQQAWASVLGRLANVTLVQLRRS